MPLIQRKCGVKNHEATKTGIGRRLNSIIADRSKHKICLIKGRSSASRSSISWEIINTCAPIKNINRKLSFRRRCFITNESSPNERKESHKDKVSFENCQDYQRWFEFFERIRLYL